MPPDQQRRINEPYRVFAFINEATRQVGDRSPVEVVALLDDRDSAAVDGQDAYRVRCRNIRIGISCPGSLVVSGEWSPGGR